MKLASSLLVFVVLAGCLSNQPGGTEQDFVGALVWPEPPTVDVDIDHVEGREPSEQTLARLETELRDHTDKQHLRIGTPTRIDVGDSSNTRRWTFEEAIAVHDDEHDAAPLIHDEEAYYLHVLILNGEIRLDDGGYVLGFAAPGRIILFPDRFDMEISVAGQVIGAPPPEGNPTRESGWQALLVHELGHLLGLVDAGAPMLTPRLNPDDPCACHSALEDSVMHSAVETINVERWVESGEFRRTHFDEHDVADIAAKRDEWQG